LPPGIVARWPAGVVKHNCGCVNPTCSGTGVRLLSGLLTGALLFYTRPIVFLSQAPWHGLCGRFPSELTVMKTRLCLFALLLSHSVRAALIDFNDIPIGTEVTSLNPYGNAIISPRLWVTQRGSTVFESLTRGLIATDPDGSPSVSIYADWGDAPSVDRPSWHIDIAVSFIVPVSTFSVDACSRIWSSRLFYSGIDGSGEAFTSQVTIPSRLGPEVFTHFDIAAPTGGYITDFHFSQTENFFGIHLAMDNLSYTVPEAIIEATASPAVLWPPNNQWRSVQLTVRADDARTVNSRIISITGNQPISGDWKIVDDLSVLLRAKRSGTGGDRIYYILLECSDVAGNKSLRTVTVRVPHDQRSKHNRLVRKKHRL